MKPLNLNAKKPSLKQVNGPEVTPAENQGATEAPPLREQEKELRALPQVVVPEGVKTPEDFDEMFAMALRVRTGKPGMADYWARMAQADALNRIAKSLDRLNEFMGVYDNDENPDEDSVRLFDVLEAVLEDAKKKS